MSMPEVSVVIAAYNAERYVHEAIQSVLDQTFDNLEVVVIDDGSTDDTLDIIRQFRSPRVRVFAMENAGQTTAKNRGIRESTGRFVGFCDADDRWHPEKLEKQLPLFDASENVAVVYSSESSIDHAGNVLPDRVDASLRGRVVDALFLENFVPFGSALVRRECLLKVGAFDEDLRMGIDWDLWLRIAAHHDFECVPDSLYVYRKWPGQMSTNWRGRYDSAFRIMRKFEAEHPGLISASTRRRAYANTYTNRGRAGAAQEPRGAFIDGLHGVALDPLNWYSWKSILRILWGAASAATGQAGATVKT